MTIADYDLGYFEGVRNILMIVLRMNNNTEELLKAIKNELADAERCMEETSDEIQEL